MGKTMKKILCSLLVVVICLTSAPLQGLVGLEWPEFNFSNCFGGKARANSGKCGENLTWHRDGDTLFISGNGEMTNYTSRYETPWKDLNYNVKSLIVEDGVTSISAYAFMSFYYLENIYIPTSVRKIREGAFLHTKWYNSQPDGVVYINDICYCYKGEPTENISITISSGTTYITPYAFSDMTSLTKIYIPYGVTEIGGFAFKGCENLEIIHIPNSVKRMGTYAFRECFGVKSVYFSGTLTEWYNISSNYGPDRPTYFAEQFYICNELVAGKIVIPKEIKQVSSCLSGYHQITDVILEEGVKELSGNAFQYCNNLTTMYIPKTVVEIGGNAFDGCYNFSDIFYAGTQEDWEKMIGDKKIYGSPNIHYNSTSTDEPEDQETEIVFDNGNNYYIYTGSSMLLHDENNFKISGLSAKMYSDNLTYEDVEWSCSDESILKITDSGGFYYREKGYHVLTLDVKALKLGTVTLTATASDGTTESCTVTVKGEDCYLEVESVNSSNSIPVDEILPLWVALYKNGKQTYEEKTFNLSFDNPGIFDVVFSNSNTNSEGAYFTLELKAKKEGVTNLTISDSETGAYITVLLTATPKMNVYYFNNVPSKEYQKGRQTNFYNYNGLCIDYFNYTQQNGYYYVNMNAYNSKHHYGVAVSYNSIGEIHDFEILEPYKEYKTTLTENIAELGYSIYDLGKLFGDKYYYTGDSISKHTHVQLEIPQNGYVVITNNCSENELAYLVNMIEYTTNVALSTVSASIGMSEKSALIKDLSKSIVKDLIESGLIQVVQTYASSLSKNISYKNINLNVAEFTEAMKKLDLDIVKIVTDAINLEFGISLAESVLWNILPTGKVIEMMFAFNDAQNIVAQADDFSKSYNAPLIVIYPPLNDDDAYTSNGVVVNPETELSPEYVLHSYIVAENNQVAIEADKVLNGLSEQYKLYNITLYKGGKEAQPNGKIKVMIPIPVGYDRNNIMVYWYKEDGTIESVSAKVEGDYATFVTEHLSYYALVEHSHTFDGSKCTSCGYDKADECGCNCHASGIKKFFFNFILFFQKLFKKNAVCDCGVAHY
ncbi:MAG: leucine-rich repeat domain-containing protein [Clostridia bacterium]|nr:leucine-rich repeat domain-containing protein [Clostridia bacterium]